MVLNKLKLETLVWALFFMGEVCSSPHSLERFQLLQKKDVLFHHVDEKVRSNELKIFFTQYLTFIEENQENFAPRLVKRFQVLFEQCQEIIKCSKFDTEEDLEIFRLLVHEMNALYAVCHWFLLDSINNADYDKFRRAVNFFIYEMVKVKLFGKKSLTPLFETNTFGSESRSCLPPPPSPLLVKANSC